MSKSGIIVVTPNGGMKIVGNVPARLVRDSKQWINAAETLQDRAGIVPGRNKANGHLPMPLAPRPALV